MLADAHVDGFVFRIGRLDGDDRLADLGFDTPFESLTVRVAHRSGRARFGSLTVGSRIEVAQRPRSTPVGAHCCSRPALTASPRC